MHINEILIIGAGGHSKVVLDALELTMHDHKVILCDDNPERIGQQLAGHLVHPTPQPLSSIVNQTHVAIGNNLLRQKIYRSLSKEAALLTIIHPNAVISKTAEIAAGSLIAAGAILRPGSMIGEGCIINHAAIVDHDVKVGSYTHIAPNSTLGGKVSIGEGVLIGAGAVILPGVIIGSGATVGAGAVVTRNVREHAVVKGIPAR